MKVLLVDTGFSAAPIHDALQRLGCEVHVVGSRPDDYLARRSRHYWQVDYSDTERLGQLVNSQGFEALVPGCTDVSYDACVRVGAGRFPGLDSAVATERLSDKAQFRSVCGELNLPAPMTCDPAPGVFPEPVIIKPVDAFSGKGITVLPAGDAAQFAAAVARARAASRSGRYLVETFVEGQLFSHSAFLRDGQIAVDFVVREDCTANPFVVDTSCVVTEPDDAGRVVLRECVIALAQALGLEDGLFHTQYIHRAGRVALIEVTRRCPGDLYSRLIELSTGFPYAEAYTRSFLGVKGDSAWPSVERAILRHTVSVSREQPYGGMRFALPILIEQWVPLLGVGGILQPSPVGRAGVLFVRGGDQCELETLYRAVLDHNFCEILS